MSYSVEDIRGIMKRAPRRSEGRVVDPTKGELPEHYLTAPNLEEFDTLTQTFLKAARNRDPMWIRIMRNKIRHESQHALAINGLGGLAVYTLVTWKPEGFIDKRYPHQLQVQTQGLDPASPEFAVSTAYPERLSAEDTFALDNRGLTVPDVDRIAVEHGWHQFRPLSLQQGQQDRHP
jgi:hypothetical protein